MELALLFYLADIVGSLALTLVFLSILIIGSLIVFVAISGETESHRDNAEETKRKIEHNRSLVKSCAKKCLAALFLIVIAALLPSKSGIYQMAAAYGVQSAASNPEVQRVAGKSLQVLEQSLDEYLKKGKGK